MLTTIQCPWRFRSELHREQVGGGVPLSSLDVTEHLVDLVDEALVRGILAGALAEPIDRLQARIEPVLARNSLVERIAVSLGSGGDADYSVEFVGGRWNRLRYRRVQQLREEGTLGREESACHALSAFPASDIPELADVELQAPPIVDGTLQQYGVRRVTDGELTHDRPILINTRLEADSIAACWNAGPRETGAAVLGVLLRLPEPLPNTTTRIVTLLTAMFEDSRHAGQVNEWSINAEALAECAQIADLRGLGESVLTVIHSHGFSSECGKCNENADCPLAECTHVSLSDYQVLDTLFPGKSTVMPIVGRKLGAPARQPVLAMHAWRGGEMRPMRFQRYVD